LVYPPESGCSHRSYADLEQETCSLAGPLRLAPSRSDAPVAASHDGPPRDQNDHANRRVNREGSVRSIHLAVLLTEHEAQREATEPVAGAREVSGHRGGERTPHPLCDRVRMRRFLHPSANTLGNDAAALTTLPAYPSDP